jgi:hypothetical protein
MKLLNGDGHVQEKQASRAQPDHAKWRSFIPACRFNGDILLETNRLNCAVWLLKCTGLLAHILFVSEMSRDHCHLCHDQLCAFWGI